MAICPRCGQPTRAAAYVDRGDGTARVDHRRIGGGRCVVVLPLRDVPPGVTLVPDRTAAARHIPPPPPPGGTVRAVVVRARD